MHGLDGLDGCVTAVVLRSLVNDGVRTCGFVLDKNEEEESQKGKGVAPVSRTYYISRDNEEHGGRSSSSD